MLTTNNAPAEMSDQELENHIKSCAALLEQEMGDGNRTEALEWMQKMNDAIRLRSPAQVAKMEAERGLNTCFFHDQAGRDLPAMLKRQAA